MADDKKAISDTRVTPDSKLEIDNKIKGIIKSKEDLKKIIAESTESRKQPLLLDANVVDNYHIKVALGVFIVWIIFNYLILILAPTPTRKYLPENAQNASKLTSILMLFSFLGRIMPRFALGSIASKRKDCYSGVLICVLVVNFCAAFSNAMLGWLPAVIYVDPITKCDVNMLRWCEWIPLSFAMAFLTDGIDAEESYTPFILSSTQFFGTLLGACLPFVSNYSQWIIVFSLAFGLFVNVYLRLYKKLKRFQTFKRGKTVEEIEEYDRVALSYRLIVIGSSTWTGLVLIYFLRWYLKYFYDYQNVDLNEVLECFADIIAKYFFTDIIEDAHYRIFDLNLKTERKLEELRRTMTAIWKSSNDVLIISAKYQGDRAKTLLSPALYSMLTSPNESFGRVDEFNMDLEENSFTIEQSLKTSGTQSSDQNEPIGIRDIKAIITKAWNSTSHSDECSGNSEIFISQDMHLFDNPNVCISCELSVSYLDQDSIVMVLRDVTERCKRFEAEKKMVSQVTSRKKDNEANRFTRHEVKNGLLAAIGLCDNFKEEIATAPGAIMIKMSAHDQQRMDTSFSQKSETGLTTSPITGLNDISFEDYSTVFDERLDEIGTALHQTLDIVTAHTLSRDLINGEYVPRMEYLNVPSLFNSGTKKNDKRLIFSTIPDPFPEIALDYKLLQYIHRNAVSNAMKYGKKDGMIETKFIVHRDKKIMEMQILNQPGPSHANILELGDKAKDLIFISGKSLHNSFSRAKYEKNSRSTGDGAWIMKECASCMGGICDIHFKADKTIFTLEVPIKLKSNLPPKSASMYFEKNSRYSEKVKEIVKEIDPKEQSLEIFPLPVATWGIAIDDSRVQRKLLKKCLRTFGISEERTIVKGSTFAEVRDFSDFVVDHVTQNPTDYVLIIADENMDITDEATGAHERFSGSLAIQEILSRLCDGQGDSKVLALVRSANDSSSDIALYKSRSHGFLPKAPLNKAKLELMMTPLWVNRFVKEPRIQEMPNKDSLSDDTIEIEFENSLSVEADFIYLINRIDSLIKDQADPKSSALLVRELLHVMKGDLMTYDGDDSCVKAMNIMNELNNKELGDEMFSSLWKEAKVYITKTLQESRRIQ